MKKLVIFLSIPFLLFACKSETKPDNDTGVIEETIKEVIK